MTQVKALEAQAVAQNANATNGGRDPREPVYPPGFPFELRQYPTVERHIEVRAHASAVVVVAQVVRTRLTRCVVTFRRCWQNCNALMANFSTCKPS